MSGLDYYFFDVNENVVEHATLLQLSSFLSCDTVGYMNMIKFSSNILTDSVRNKREKRSCYELVQWKNKG